MKFHIIHTLFLNKYIGPLQFEMHLKNILFLDIIYKIIMELKVK